MSTTVVPFIIPLGRTPLRDLSPRVTQEDNETQARIVASLTLSRTEALQAMRNLCGAMGGFVAVTTDPGGHVAIRDSASDGYRLGVAAGDCHAAVVFKTPGQASDFAREWNRNLTPEQLREKCALVWVSRLALLESVVSRADELLRVLTPAPLGTSLNR